MTQVFLSDDCEKRFQQIKICDSIKQMRFCCLHDHKLTPHSTRVFTYKPQEISLSSFERGHKEIWLPFFMQQIAFLDLTKISYIMCRWTFNPEFQMKREKRQFQEYYTQCLNKGVRFFLFAALQRLATRTAIEESRAVCFKMSCAQVLVFTGNWMACFLVPCAVVLKSRRSHIQKDTLDTPCTSRALSLLLLYDAVTYSAIPIFASFQFQDHQDHSSAQQVAQNTSLDIVFICETIFLEAH